MMKRKTKTELRKLRNRLPTADHELHHKLRDILTKEGPCRYAKLRDPMYGISPIEVERQNQNYPDIFYVVESAPGREPVIALHENAPTREDSLMKKQLIALVQKAAETGTYTSSLHHTTVFNSSDIERLLKEVPEIEAKPVSRKGFLYRWIGPLPKPVQAVPPPEAKPVQAKELAGELSEVVYDDELKFHPASPGSALRRPTPGRPSFYARDGRVRTRHEPPTSITLTNDHEDQPMNIKKAHQILLKHVADAFETGRHLERLIDSGLSGDTIQAVLAAYPNDFVIDEIKEVSETFAGKPTKYRIVSRVVRVAPELLTATKSVRVSDMSGDYEVEHAYPVLQNGQAEETP